MLARVCYMSQILNNFYWLTIQYSIIKKLNFRLRDTCFPTKVLSNNYGKIEFCLVFEFKNLLIFNEESRECKNLPCILVNSQSSKFP